MPSKNPAQRLCDIIDNIVAPSARLPRIVLRRSWARATRVALEAA